MAFSDLFSIGDFDLGSGLSQLSRGDRFDSGPSWADYLTPSSGGGFSLPDFSEMFNIDGNFDLGDLGKFDLGSGLENILEGFNQYDTQSPLGSLYDLMGGEGLNSYIDTTPFMTTPEEIDSSLFNTGALSSDDILDLDLQGIGKDALYETIKDQLDRGLITEEGAENLYRGLTSDGKAYDFSSPEQDKALAAQRGVLDHAVKNAQNAQNSTSTSGLGSILKSVLDNAGTIAKIGGAGLKIADLLKNEPSNKLEPLNLSGVGPRGGPAAATVNWNAGKPREARKFYADGGPVRGAGLTSITIELADRLARQKGLLKGKDGGQDDVVDIKAAPGEYVLDAEFVSALGDGNTEAGARKLDQMRQNLRKHKRGGALSQIAPKAKNPAEYLKG